MEPPDPSSSKQSPSPSPATPPSSRLFVCNLPLDYTQDQLFALFSPYGPINRAFLPSKLTSSGKKFGFIFFPSAAAASSAVSAMHRHPVGSERLIVDFSIGQARGAARRPEPSPSALPSGRPSFKDVVQGNRPSAPSSPAPSVALSCSGAPNLFWSDFLKRSVIGIASPLLSADSIRASLPLFLRPRLLLKSLGLGVFLISFPDAPSLRASEASKWVDLKQAFFNIVQDVSSVSNGGSFRWVSIAGIPLSGWSEASIHGVASTVGTPLSIHPCSILLRRLDLAFALVHSRHLDPVNLVVELIIEGSRFLTRVKEVEPHLIPPLPIQSPVEDALEEGEFRLADPRSAFDGSGFVPVESEACKDRSSSPALVLSRTSSDSTTDQSGSSASGEIASIHPSPISSEATLDLVGSSPGQASPRRTLPSVPPTTSPGISPAITASLWDATSKVGDGSVPELLSREPKSPVVPLLGPAEMVLGSLMTLDQASALGPGHIMAPGQPVPLKSGPLWQLPPLSPNLPLSPHLFLICTPRLS